MNSRQLLFLSIAMALLLFLCSCSIMLPVVGFSQKYNEIFKGVANANMLGSSQISIEGINSKIQCTGQSYITYVPPSGACRGQRGKADVRCSDGRIISGDFIATSCTTGHARGKDQEDNLFIFTFGMNEAQAQVIIQNELSVAKKRPDLPSLYRPKETRQEKGFNTGTGFFVTEDGHLITNYHVIEDATQIVIVTEDATELTAKVVQVDPTSDLALLKVERNVNPLSLVSTSGLSKGEDVFSLGYPLIMIQGQEQKATFGRINSLSGIKGDLHFLQIDLPIQPGNSGGPLINRKGQVIGIVTATLNQLVTLRETGALPQNVNYAVKSDYAMPLLSYSLGDKWKSKAITEENIEFPKLIKKCESAVVLVIAK